MKDMRRDWSKTICLAALICLMGVTAVPQDLPVVRSTAGASLAFPWAGGMNSCQFGAVDIDLDGKKDLIVFDRTGDRIMPFINVGGSGEMNWAHHPEYVSAFPSLYHWMIMVDYNGDGKEDIFTFSPDNPGMLVYKNAAGASLEFELVVYPYLTSFQGGGYTNIFVTYADYPGIADLDGDGDLDILTFWGLGSFVEMHRNLSMEKYGHADSLDFEKTEYCWGYFAESEESNELTLDTCLTMRWSPGDAEHVLLPHTGSTFLVTDLQADGVPDLILGDVDYPNLILLENDGTPASAHIGAYDLNFPSYDLPVHLFSMPAASMQDIDNDGLDDLLVSPFDPNPFISENKFSSWLYLNTGNEESPYFELEQDDFLQREMIDVGAGSCPVLADYDGDGLDDLFIGNYGYYLDSYYDEWMILHTTQSGRIALFRNTGSSSVPAFSFITDDFANLSSKGIKGVVPAFGDLDGDGDLDMLTGSEYGRLCFYENLAGEGNPMEMEFIECGFGGIEPGEYSTPQLFDLDRDGNLDLIIGEKDGNLNYYRGIPGNPVNSFQLVTENLGGINVTNPNVSLDGYSVPFFFRDGLGRTLLTVGSEDGVLFFFNDIDGNLSGAFSESDTLGAMIGQAGWNGDRGYRTACCLADLDGDGRPELIAGNFGGGLEYFSRTGLPPVSGCRESESLVSLVDVFPNPSRGMLAVRATGLGSVKICSIGIYSPQGQLIFSSDFRDVTELKINTAGFPPGIHLMRITLNLSDGRLHIINKKVAIFN